MLGTGSKKIIAQELSIRIASDGFSFSTPSGEKNVRIKEGETLTDVLATAFRNYSILRPDFDEVTVYADYLSTRIPLDEFRSEEAQAIFRLTFGEESLHGMNIHYDMLPALEVIEVFVLPEGVEDIILQHYPHATIHSFFGQLMNRTLAMEKRREDQTERLYVHSDADRLLIFAYDNGRLAFANSFDAATPTNRLYYLLNVWKTLGLRQTKDVCVLLEKDKTLEHELKKYLRNIES